MSDKAEKKNRFEISREVQEEFVNGIAQNMLTLAENAGEWQKGWASASPPGIPFCAATGREYSGANMVRLMLTSMLSGYNDDRWMTFNQLQEIQSKNPDLELHIRKGEHGTKILRPEEIFFTVDEDGKWNFLKREDIKRLREAEANGEEIPEVKRKTLFYPFTVFNAAQIEGFPAKETPDNPMTEIERNDLVERFVASSGVVVEHGDFEPCFKHAENVVQLPRPNTFHTTEEYYAAKLHEFFHATGHESREDRQKKKEQTLKGYAFEEMRAEMFSMLAGAMLHLPMPESNSAAYINFWNQKFSGGDARAVFQSASEAAKMLTAVCQYQRGEEPSAKWFPKREEWAALIDIQRQRDIANGIHVQVKEGSDHFVTSPRQKREPKAPVRLPEIVEDFKAITDNPAAQARMILQSPDFLDMALKMDPKQVMELANLCNRFSTVLSMEAEAMLSQAPKAVENSIPLNEQKIAAQTRMRV